MPLKYPVNLHKGMTALVVVGLMLYFHNFSVTAWIYLALHGSYGILWLMKDRIFPDKQWEQRVSVPYAVFVFVVLGLYWLPPYLIISQGIIAPPYLIGISVAVCVMGVMLHFASDAQKYFTLKYHKGLITDGFFSHNRNTNYLGELMIYSGFALLTTSAWGFIGIGLFFIGAFIPNMMKKDKSLSRYPEFMAYKKNTGLLFPKLFRNR
jgi:protein-S-isoprenylcysteine O-methyltransferase Ste14